MPPNIIDDESSPSSVSVRENQNLSLSCKAEGSPTPKISWKREDGGHIAMDRKKKGICVVRCVQMIIMTEKLDSKNRNAYTSNICSLKLSVDECVRKTRGSFLSVKKKKKTKIVYL